MVMTGFLCLVSFGSACAARAGTSKKAAQSCDQIKARAGPDINREGMLFKLPRIGTCHKIDPYLAAPSGG